MNKAPIESIYILYWQDSKKAYRHNTFTPEIREFVERHLEAAIRQKGFDFVMVNINHLTDEYNRFKSIAEKHRGQKLKKWPLVVIDEGDDYIVVNSGGRLKQVESLFAQIYEHYFG